MEKIEKKLIIYKAKDGSEFENVNDCEFYEKQMKFRDYYSTINSKEIFEVTENHLKLLQKCYIDYNFLNRDFENGSFVQNLKRPYGNSDWYSDIAEILNIEPEEGSRTKKRFSENQYFQMWKTHFELTLCVQILCRTLSIKKGFYIREKYTQNWVFSHNLT